MSESVPAGPADQAEIRQFLSTLIERRIGNHPAPDADLFELGLDSIDAVEISGEAEIRFGAEVDPHFLFEACTLDRAAAALAAVLARGS